MQENYKSIDENVVGYLKDSLISKLESSVQYMKDIQKYGNPFAGTKFESMARLNNFNSESEYLKQISLVNMWKNYYSGHIDNDEMIGEMRREMTKGHDLSPAYIKFDKVVANLANILSYVTLGAGIGIYGHYILSEAKNDIDLFLGAILIFAGLVGRYHRISNSKLDKQKAKKIEEIKDIKEAEWIEALNRAKPKIMDILTRV